jgi:hypothetical protein
LMWDSGEYKQKGAILLLINKYGWPNLASWTT